MYDTHTHIFIYSRVLCGHVIIRYGGPESKVVT